MIDWGSVPDWIAAIGTAGALVATVAVLRTEQFTRHSAQVSRLFVEYKESDRASWQAVRSRNARIVMPAFYLTSEEETAAAFSLPTAGASSSRLMAAAEDYGAGADILTLFDVIIENASDSPIANCILHFPVERLLGGHYYADDVVVDVVSPHVFWEHRRHGWRRRRRLRISVPCGGYLKAHEKRRIATVARLDPLGGPSLSIVDSDGREWIRMNNGRCARVGWLDGSRLFGWHVFAAHKVRSGVNVHDLGPFS